MGSVSAAEGRIYTDFHPPLWEGGTNQRTADSALPGGSAVDNKPVTTPGNALTTLAAKPNAQAPVEKKPQDLTGLNDADLWKVAAPLVKKNEIVALRDGDVRVFIVRQDAKLVPIVRGKQEEYFVDTATGAAKSKDLDVAINGLQYEVTFSGVIDYLWGNDPINKDYLIPIGKVIDNGKYVIGRSSPETFYVAQTVTKEKSATQFGFGDPPAGVTTAFGGGVPIIINGLRYNEVNVYAPGTSKDAPDAGDPGKYAAQLELRSNNGFKAFVEGYEIGGNFSTGKAILAHSSKHNALAVIVQPDGAANGISLSDLRDRLHNAGFNNAVAFDGSTSATLVRDEKLEVAPSQAKNMSITTGIGIRRAE